MLTYKNQEAVSTRELAWGNVGENVADENMTAAEMLDKAGLSGWGVRQVPISTTLGDHDTAFDDAGLIVPNQYATVATIDEKPKVLGVVGNRYQIFQNEDMVEFLDTIIDDGGANGVAAGSLANHRKTFAVMKLPNGILVGGEDRSDLYLGVQNSHDGSGSLVAWVTAMRLRCTNMLTGSLRGAMSKWRLRHTSGLQGKVEDARRSLSLTFQWADEFQRLADEWLATSFSDAEFEHFLDEISPRSESEHEGWRKRADEKRDALTHLFYEAETNEFGRGTKWGAYNAVTEYADWYLPIKGADADGSRRAARNLESATTDGIKQRAMALLSA